MPLRLSYLSLLPLLCMAVPLPEVQKINERPIIGIVAQEVTDEAFVPFGKTYIADSYVKFLESAGCRVIPIRLNLTEEEYLRIFKSINGVLFPGGDVDLLASSFARTAGIFYRLAVENNNILQDSINYLYVLHLRHLRVATSSGNYFPIWGTCMGFQILTSLTSGKDLLVPTSASNISLPLNLTYDISSSKMFQHASPELLRVLRRENVTANFHHFGITPEVFQANEKLSTFYRILSTNRDKSEVEFVSTIEARNFPIYGVQWHPEVNRFQWRSDHAYPHSVNAMWISQYTANFFVNEARKNMNTFSSVQEEEESLIYNWTPKYTANISGYEQAYFF